MKCWQQFSFPFSYSIHPTSLGIILIVWQSRIYVLQKSDQCILQQDEKRYPEESYAYDKIFSVSEKSDIQIIVLWDCALNLIRHLLLCHLETALPDVIPLELTVLSPASFASHTLVKEPHFPEHTLDQNCLHENYHGYSVLLRKWYSVENWSLSFWHWWSIWIMEDWRWWWTFLEHLDYN